MMLGFAPDRQWLGFTQKMSLGPFSRNLTPAEQDQSAYGKASAPDEQSLAAFDRQAEFLPKYATRRSMLQNYVETKKALRVLEGDYGSQVPKR
jgi:hypothetical protein